MVPVSVALVDAAALVDAVAQTAAAVGLADVVALALVDHVVRPPLVLVVNAFAQQAAAVALVSQVGLPELSRDHESGALVVESRPLALPAAVVYPLVPPGPLVVTGVRRVLPAPVASPCQHAVVSVAVAVEFSQCDQPRVEPHYWLEIDQGHASHLEIVLRAWR